MKTMEDGASEDERIEFLQEAAIMGQFNHPNVIKILGIVIIPESVSFPKTFFFDSHQPSVMIHKLFTSYSHFCSIIM